ncbi:MAG: hypothetical protein M3268_08610 [Acidobacteriota bacterium]|nr:hypothetical protein [Acidobacteriota bacterium]
MRVERIAAVAASLLVAFALCCAGASSRVAAQESPQSQHDAASKTAKFGSVEKTSDAYKSALDAHDLEGASKLVGKDGAFRGTVAKVFEQRDGSLLIIDFDPNFRTALTAVLRRADYAKFPDVRELEGKEIVVSGKFTDFRGRAQIELSDPAQIKIVK